MAKEQRSEEPRPQQIFIGEGSRILELSEDATRRLADSGRLSVTRLAGGIRLLDRDEVEALARERRAR